MSADPSQNLASTDENIPSFIRKTYKILEDDKYSDIISWNDEGNAVVIKNPTEFAQTILPTYFKHNNLNSFIRQLNMYDFHKKKTPDGENVYYHELFQRGKKSLLKNIRRKNAESSMLSNEKSRLGMELVRTKQDIATIINENILLNKINRESLATISNLEAKINELTIQNQTLWSQLMKFNEKEEILKSFVPNVKREIPSFPLSNIDTNANKALGENIGGKLGQTTTRIPHFSADNQNQRNWNLMGENFEEVSIPSYYNPGINENKPPNIGENRNKREQRGQLQSKNFSDPALASELSQQIVRNMDQELQYLKKLTSSNARNNGNLPSMESPDNVLLGKGRISTDPGQQQNINPYENINKLYKPENLMGLNFMPGNFKPEVEGGIEGEH